MSPRDELMRSFFGSQSKPKLELDASDVIGRALDAVKGMPRAQATSYLETAVLDAEKRDLPGKQTLRRVYESYRDGKPYRSIHDSKTVVADSKPQRVLVLGNRLVSK